jgi:hypothetical protein
MRGGGSVGYEAGLSVGNGVGGALALRNTGLAASCVHVKAPATITIASTAPISHLFFGVCMAGSLSVRQANTVRKLGFHVGWQVTLLDVGGEIIDGLGLAGL